MRTSNTRSPCAARRRAERASRVGAALERVGMTSRARQRPGQLSGGHQQLVAIARAIAGKPPILLADEPTGNLDSKTGDALMDVLSELHAGGATVILATHNPLYIERAERHIYLFDGRVTGGAGGGMKQSRATCNVLGATCQPCWVLRATCSATCYMPRAGCHVPGARPHDSGRSAQHVRCTWHVARGTAARRHVARVST